MARKKKLYSKIAGAHPRPQVLVVEWVLIDCTETILETTKMFSKAVFESEDGANKH